MFATATSYFRKLRVNENKKQMLLQNLKIRKYLKINEIGYEIL